jgi:hypothetical protein
MTLQADDQLWEHLQGKSREELLGLLEQIMKKQPEIKGLLKLLLELPLTSGARAEHKAGVGRVRTLEPATIQAQVRAAFAQAGHAWGYSMLAATDLYRVLDIGDRFTEAGQWANAQVVYATVADAILSSYEELEEEDHLAGVLGGCLGGLLSCLEAQPELSVEEQLEEADRQALLASLFALWKHGCEYGIEVDEIPQALAQQATRDEQALMVQWVRQEKALDEAAGSTWLNRHLADFLALLTTQ